MKSFLFSPGETKSRLSVTVVGALAFGLLAVFSGTSLGAEEPKSNDNPYEIPGYYPDDYAELIEKSKSEGGELVIYSNTAQHNWAPIFRAFKKKYPWIKSVSANNLNSDKVFQRVLSAQAIDDVTMDLAVSNATVAWAEFAAKDDTLMPYDSPELQKLPDFAEVLPNVYVMSADPMLMIYNTALMDQAPTGIADLAKIVSSNPEEFEDRIEIRDPKSSFGFTINHAFLENTEGAWDSYAKILPLARPESSSGTMTEKIIIGEYKVGFLISGSVFPIVADSQGLVKYVYPDDGTVVLPRGIGIVAGAPHPATAKLFIDFLMSMEGQKAVAKGGLSSYRDGVKDDAPEIHTYQEVVEKVGEENIIFVEYEKVSEEEVNKFLERFYKLMEL